MYSGLMTQRNAHVRKSSAKVVFTGTTEVMCNTITVCYLHKNSSFGSHPGGQTWLEELQYEYVCTEGGVRCGNNSAIQLSTMLHIRTGCKICPNGLGNGDTVFL
jgi:hypothetical protein